MTENVYIIRPALFAPVILTIGAVILAVEESWWLAALPFIWLGSKCAQPNLNLANGCLAYLAMILGFILFIFFEPLGAPILVGGSVSFYASALEKWIRMRPAQTKQSVARKTALTTTQLTHTTFTDFVKSHRYVVIHFWAAWNGYDVAMRNLIESELPEEFHKKVHFGAFDIDPPENHEICKSHQVIGPPFLAYYRDGNLIQTKVGMQKLDLMIENLRILISETPQTK